MTPAATRSSAGASSPPSRLGPTASAGVAEGLLQVAGRTCPSATEPSLASVNDQKQRKLARRVLCAVDLAIDFATLGEYGLELLPADGPCREQPGPRTGWGARDARRGGCPMSAAARVAIAASPPERPGG